MHPRLITDGNVLQEIISLCSILCLVFHTRQDGLLSDLPSRDEELTLPTLFSNQNHLKWLIGHSHTIFRHVQKFNMLSPTIISRIARIFISLVLVRVRCARVSFCTDSRPSENCLCQLQTLSMKALFQRTVQLFDAKFRQVLLFPATKT